MPMYIQSTLIKLPYTWYFWDKMHPCSMFIKSTVCLVLLEADASSMCIKSTGRLVLLGQDVIYICIQSPIEEGSEIHPERPAVHLVRSPVMD